MYNIKLGDIFTMSKEKVDEKDLSILGVDIYWNRYRTQQQTIIVEEII
jgi:hypothetical protein